jgi:hypothetical protein
MRDHWYEMGRHFFAACFSCDLLLTLFLARRFLSLWLLRRHLPPTRRFFHEPYSVLHSHRSHNLKSRKVLQSIPFCFSTQPRSRLLVASIVETHSHNSTECSRVPVWRRLCPWPSCQASLPSGLPGGLVSPSPDPGVDLEALTWQQTNPEPQVPEGVIPARPASVRQALTANEKKNINSVAFWPCSTEISLKARSRLTYWHLQRENMGIVLRLG